MKTDHCFSKCQQIGHVFVSMPIASICIWCSIYNSIIFPFFVNATTVSALSMSSE